MNTIINSVITGTGSYIPKLRVKNEDFLSKEFFDSSGQRLEKTNQEVIEKFLEITTIAERRFAREDMLNSQMAFQYVYRLLFSTIRQIDLRFRYRVDELCNFTSPFISPKHQPQHNQYCHANYKIRKTFH